MVKTFQEYMIMNNKNELVQRWSSHGDGLLKGLNESEKEACAIFLQAQLDRNEPSLTDNSLQQFRRISIPLTRRVFSGVQIETSLKSLPKWAVVAEWPFKQHADDHYNIDVEAEECAKLAGVIVKSIEENNITKIHSFRLNDGNVEVNYE